MEARGMTDGAESPFHLNSIAETRREKQQTIS